MTNYPATYYAATRNAVDARPAQAGDQVADVCVVGGGLAGLSVAIGLAERGRTPLLLEAQRIGWGASGRNGGFLGAGFALRGAALVDRVGLDRARELYRLSEQAVATIETRVERYGIGCGLARSGHMLASWFDRREALSRHQAWLAETYGVATELWPRERLRALYRTSRYHDGLLNPAGRQFHPLNYSLGLAAAIERLGGRVFESTPVLAIDTDGAEAVVTTPGGRVRAAQVVVAGGGYLGNLVPRIGRGILPIATYVAVTEAAPDRLDTALTAMYPTYDDRFAQNYYRRLPDGRLLWGGGVATRRTDPRDLAETMRRDLLSVFPQLAGVRIETAWGGLMSYARHRMPQVGRLGRGAWYAQAFGGVGMGTTTLAGELIASAIAEGDDRYRLLGDFGLDWAGGRFGLAWAGATYGWYRARDRLKALR